MVDQRCRGSKGKAKIEGYMSISDEEAHQHVAHFKAYKLEVGSGTHPIVYQEPLGCGITSKRCK